MATTDDPAQIDIGAELARRDRFRLAQWRAMTVGERTAAMDRLQRQAAATLCANPVGYDHWFRRNMTKRAIDVSPMWSIRRGA